MEQYPPSTLMGQIASNQGYAEDANNYYVWYTTHFSTHQISIVFTASSSISEFPTLMILPLFGVAVLLSIVFIKKRKSKNSPTL